MNDGAVTIQIENLDQILKAFKQAPVKMTQNVNKAIDRIVLKLESSAKRNAPVNKNSGGGNLRQSIRGRMIGLATGEVRVGASYGIFVHEGTRPHLIQVRSRKVLANQRTKSIFGKVVHHPGTKANPFLQDAVDQNQDFIDKEFQKAVDDVINLSHGAKF